MPVSTAEVTRRKMHLAIGGDFGLDNGGDEAGKRGLYANAAAGARRQRLSPIGLFRHQIERGFQARITAEHAAAEIDRVHARLARQLVHEAFDGEDVIVRSDAAPESGRHRRRLGAHILDRAVRDVVGHVDGAIDRVDVDAVLECRPAASAP